MVTNTILATMHNKIKTPTSQSSMNFESTDKKPLLGMDIPKLNLGPDSDIDYEELEMLNDVSHKGIPKNLDERK